MINLFNINHYNIDTSKFSNLLNSSIVGEFESRFAEYVGAKYACSANSASSLLYLSLREMDTQIRLPSIVPPVVPNLVINAGNTILFYDDVSWVGHCYQIYHGIYDSAQEVYRNQCSTYNLANAVMIFSFYPTKPIGSCDGGMVVSDNKQIIDNYREMVNNGMSLNNANSWDNKQARVGYKMHANSIQMYIANENLNKLDEKNARLDEIRNKYNKALGMNNTSRHLYRINVKDNVSFVNSMKKDGVVCGIHYGAAHLNPLFYKNEQYLPKSEEEEVTTVSLPFHEKLTEQDIRKVIEHAKPVAII